MTLHWMHEHHAFVTPYYESIDVAQKASRPCETVVRPIGGRSTPRD